MLLVPARMWCIAHGIVQGAVHLRGEDASDEFDGIPDDSVDLGNAA